LTLSSGAKFAVLNVGKVHDTVLELSDDSRELMMTHYPIEPINLSHSGIDNLRDDDLLIAELIRTTIIETLDARQ
jgi:hypothetical protein